MSIQELKRNLNDEDDERPFFATFGLNGDIQQKDKVQSVVRLKDRKTTQFGPGQMGQVRKVEVWTFEKRQNLVPKAQ